MFEYLCAPILFYLAALFTHVLKALIGRNPSAKWAHEVTQEAIKEYLEAIDE